MNVLLLTSAYPNMTPDLLLHGMRKLIGDAAAAWLSTYATSRASSFNSCAERAPPRSVHI